MNTIPVGSNHEQQEVESSVRTPQQHEAVAHIVGQSDFDFACGNPFTPEVGNYVGPFMFVYYTNDGQMHAKKIGKRGNIMRSFSPQ